MNFRQLDLNLLRVLVAIHRTGSVTLAGKALSLSQPATSNALARLRDYFGDDLFVRARSGLKPTRLCEHLAPAVLTQLLALETAVTGHEDFDPLQSDMHWRLSLSDLGEILFLPRLAGALRSQAPRASLSNISVAANDVADALEAREIDLAIGILHPRHRGIRTELLFREEYVAVAAAQWRPASGRSGRTLTTKQLAEAAFVVASPTATFHDSVEQMLVQARRAKSRKAAIMFLDLDRFKQINDNLGHEAGDECLRTVAQRIRQCVRASDTVARMGGDEFTILLPEIGAEADVRAVAQKILDVMQMPLVLAGQEVVITTSIGISLFPQDGRDGETLLKHADEAMYQVKGSGRAAMFFFAPELMTRPLRRIEQ